MARFYTEQMMAPLPCPRCGLKVPMGLDLDTHPTCGWEEKVLVAADHVRQGDVRRAAQVQAVVDEINTTRAVS